MPELIENGKKIKMENGQVYDLQKCFVQIECAKADLKIASDKISLNENVIAEARKIGYMTEAELDANEQKKYAEEKVAREKEEKKNKK